MKRKIILGITIFILFFITGCEFFGPGMDDYDYNLTGDYLIGKMGYVEIEGGELEQQVIEPNITGIAWDEKFILAEQKYFDGVQYTYKDKTLFDDKEQINYWIINVNTNEIFGPLTRNEFDKKRNDLNVDSNLKLVDPDEYRDLDDNTFDRE